MQNLFLCQGSVSLCAVCAAPNITALIPLRIHILSGKTYPALYRMHSLALVQWGEENEVKDKEEKEEEDYAR